MHSHLKPATLTCAAAVLALASFGSAFAQGLPAAQTAGAVKYRCGGIGVDESTAMRAATKDYPLALLFAAPGGDYQADVKITISGANDASFTADGPVCLLTLPAGNYTVKAVAKDGKEKEQRVDVANGSNKSLDFRF